MSASLPRHFLLLVLFVVFSLLLNVCSLAWAPFTATCSGQGEGRLHGYEHTCKMSNSCHGLKSIQSKHVLKRRYVLQLHYSRISVMLPQLLCCSGMGPVMGQSNTSKASKVHIRGTLQKHGYKKSSRQTES